MKANRTEKIVFFLITLLLSASFWGIIICSVISNIRLIILVSIIFTCMSYIFFYVLIREAKKTVAAGTIVIISTGIIAVLLYVIKNSII